MKREFSGGAEETTEQKEKEGDGELILYSGHERAGRVGQDGRGGREPAKEEERTKKCAAALASFLLRFFRSNLEMADAISGSDFCFVYLPWPLLLFRKKVDGALRLNHLSWRILKLVLNRMTSLSQCSLRRLGRYGAVSPKQQLFLALDRLNGNKYSVHSALESGRPRAPSSNHHEIGSLSIFSLLKISFGTPDMNHTYANLVL